MRVEPSRRSWAFGALLACAVLAPDRAAAEAPEGLSLAWQAPSECPTATAVRAEVVSLLGAGLEAVVPVRAEAVVTHDARFVVVLHTTIDGAEGERTLDADTCDELARSAALVLALALSGADRPAAPEVRVAFVVRAPVEAAFGVLPAPAMVVGLDLALDVDALRISLGGHATPEAGLAYPNDASRGATMIGAWAELVLGGVLRPTDGVAIVLGGGALAGGLVARSFGVTMVGAGVAPRVSLMARASLEGSPVPWLVVALDAILEVALVRPVLAIDGLPDLFRAEPIAARLGGAIGIRWP